MRCRNIARLTAAVLLVVASSPSIPAQRRQGPFTGTVIQVAPPTLSLPCCRCVDGSSTTVNINTGTAPWGVSAPAAGGFSGAFGFPAVAPASNAAWAPVPSAQWVGPPGAPTTAGDYTYQLQFQVPQCVIPARITVAGRFAADNGASLYVDTLQIKSSVGTPNYGFLPGSVTSFSALVPPTANGFHALRLVVTNSGSYTGAILQGTITVTCPNDPLARGDPGALPSPPRQR